MNDASFRKFYPVLEINKVVLLQTDIPREVIDSLTDQDMFWIAQHLYRWYAYDFLKVLYCFRKKMICYFRRPRPTRDKR